MSLFSARWRKGLAALALVAALGSVSGCTLSPVYGENGLAQAALALNYSKPDSRLEQIVYQELSLRLGAEASPDAPVVKVVVRTGGRTLVKSLSVNPTPATELTAVGAVTVTRGTEVIASFVRKATATYTTSTQVLANQAALDAAEEQAARALAESIRLTLITTLVRA